jgi:predicted alpha/beta superfamily hydrolase
MLLASQAFSAEPYTIESRILSVTQIMPQLNREKRIWIYLPPNYGTDEDKRFPVVYMQDGQYLFDLFLSSSDNPYISESMKHRLWQILSRYGNWQVDKRLDRLFAEKKIDGVIVVGISSDDGDRTTEYSPWSWQGAPVPEGDQVIEFIVHMLKPYIDDNYLTLSGRADTAIAGSSMGGSFALYAGLKYQNIFSKVAAFSPVLTSHVLGHKFTQFIEQQGKSYAMKIYVDLGNEELNFGPLEPIHEALLRAGFLDQELWFRHIPNGQHLVEHWGQRFPQALLWLNP